MEEEEVGSWTWWDKRYAAETGCLPQIDMQQLLRMQRVWGGGGKGPWSGASNNNKNIRAIYNSSIYISRSLSLTLPIFCCSCHKQAGEGMGSEGLLDGKGISSADWTRCD